MDKYLEREVLVSYEEGIEINKISEQNNISDEDVKNILMSYKDSSRFKRTFTDEFKKMIASRDSIGVSRKQIYTELNINVATIRKACEKFGHIFKDKSTSNSKYTKIIGDFDMKRCPSCDSIRVNVVLDDTTYCKDCGSEHLFKENHVFKLNWEYLEE